MPGKRVQIDDETWQALDVLGRDTGKDFQELAIEAFGDLLRKHDRPIGLKAALRRSAGASATKQRLAVPWRALKHLTLVGLSPAVMRPQPQSSRSRAPAEAAT